MEPHMRALLRIKINRKWACDRQGRALVICAIWCGFPMKLHLAAQIQTQPGPEGRTMDLFRLYPAGAAIAAGIALAAVGMPWWRATRIAANWLAVRGPHSPGAIIGGIGFTAVTRNHTVVSLGLLCHSDLRHGLGLPVGLRARS